jgi:glycosyltransferase involved in cell wall biosynthesis
MTVGRVEPQESVRSAVPVTSVRILVTVHHTLDPNAGAPGATLRFVSALRRRGHRVTVASFDDLPVRLDEPMKSILFPFHVARMLVGGGQRRFDVVDATTGDASVWAALRGTGGPALVTRSHGLEHCAHDDYLADVRAQGARTSWKYPLYRGGLQLRSVEVSLRAAERAVFLNDHDRRYAVRRLGVSGTRAGIYRHGLADVFLGRPAPSPRAPGEPLRIAQIGRYTAAKGAAYAAAALTSVMRRHGDVRVSFLGTGLPRALILRDFPPEVHDRIDIVPSFQQRDLPALLERHHVKLFPTTSEGFGLALVEAMACGLAPIATSTPGPSEIVSRDLTGVLVAPRDAEAIEHALESLIASPETLEAIRSAAHGAAQVYSWSSAAQAAEALYTGLAAPSVSWRRGGAQQPALALEAGC